MTNYVQLKVMLSISLEVQIIKRKNSAHSCGLKIIAAQ